MRRHQRRRSRAQNTTTVVSDKEAETLAKGVGEKAGDEILEQINKSPEYKKLAAPPASRTSKPPPNAPHGRLGRQEPDHPLHRRSRTLHQKTGGAAVDLAVGLLKGKSLSIVEVGVFSLKGQLLEFKPETRTVGAGLTLAQDPDQIKLTFKLGVIASGTEVKQVNAQAVVKADDFTVTVSCAADTDKKKINLGIERWHKSLKGECIRLGTPLSLDDARRLVEGYVEHYNNARLNSAVGYITPKDMLAGRQREIHAEGIGSWRWRENSGRFDDCRLRDTLWGHCTRSPL